MGKLGGFLRRMDQLLLRKVAPQPDSLVRPVDEPTPTPPSLDSAVMREIQNEIRLIRTMASALRTVDRVQYAAKTVCEMAVAMLDDVHIAMVDLVGTSVTIVAGVGWEPGDVPLESSYCPLVVGTAEPVEIEHSLYDERVWDNPATVDGKIRSYLGVPLETLDNFVIGALCVVGYEPRVWTARERATLTMLSQQLMAVEARAMVDLLQSSPVPPGSTASPGSAP